MVKATTRCYYTPMSNYEPYVEIPEDWRNRRATSFSDFEALGKSIEGVMGKIPQETLKKLAKSYAKWLKQGHFSSVNASSSGEWQTGWRSPQAKGKLPLDIEEDLGDTDEIWSTPPNK